MKKDKNKQVLYRRTQECMQAATADVRKTCVTEKLQKQERQKKEHLLFRNRKRTIGRCFSKGRKGATAERNRQHMVSSHGKRVR